MLTNKHAHNICGEIANAHKMSMARRGGTKAMDIVTRVILPCGINVYTYFIYLFEVHTFFISLKKVYKLHRILSQYQLFYFSL